MQPELVQYLYLVDNKKDYRVDAHKGNRQKENDLQLLDPG